MTTRNMSEDSTTTASARDELKAQANRVKEDAGEFLSKARDVAREEVSKLKSAAADGLASGKQRLDDSVSTRPKTTLLIAAGAGLLLGLFLSRRR
jgi:ElaB/YqjD/DUF883 family membrane-anchored ribosome-binding protein